MRYHILNKNDYDKKWNIKKQPLAFYSPQKMREMHPDGVPLAGEAVKKSGVKQIGGLQVLDQVWSVTEFGGHSRFLYKLVGYVAVAPDKYVALIKSRIPFLILLFSLVALLLAATVGFVILLGMQGTIQIPGITTAPPTTTSKPIIPDHPLPPIDTGAEKLPEDEQIGDKVESEEGGGSVYMIYSTVANTYLDQDTYSIYFKNPNRSNHDVQVELYVTSGGKDYLMAKSGLLQAGYGINFIKKLEEAPPLQEGTYTGYFLVHYFNPKTGEKVIVESKIEDVSIFVGRA